MYEDEFSIRDEVVHEEIAGILLPLKKGSGFNMSISNDLMISCFER